GGIEYFPASKVNILDYSGDFRQGSAVVARSIIESYLTTNIHLRDNCYIDCISHTTKAWFFVDLGVHGAHIFVDVDPNKALITASYAEGDVEDGNMTRLRFLMDCLTELGFEVMKTEITLTARLDEKSAGVLGTHEIIHRAIRTIQAFASVADFDQEIEDGRITQRSLSFHSQRISTSGTGYPLYLMTKGSLYLKKLSHLLTTLIDDLVTTLNSELSRLGLDPMHTQGAGQNLIDRRFTEPISLGLGQGRFLSYVHAPVSLNPSYDEPDPREVFEREEERSLAEEMASMVTILDKVAGYSPLAEMDGSRITQTRINLVNGTITFYALRDETTYRVLRAFATDGPCLKRVCGFDNRIQDPSVVRALLSEHGYHLDLIEQFFQWTPPQGITIKGIHIPGIISCPGIATGFLKKNRPECIPGDFRHCIFFDHILTPQAVGRLKDAAGFITSGDSTLSHAQLTARTFGKPGIIIPGARWIDEGGTSVLLHRGTRGYRVREGQVITVDGFRSMVTIVGASGDQNDDFSDVVSEVFSLCLGTTDTPGTDGMPERLREIISCTQQLEVLKFIARELFLASGTLPRDLRPVVLKSLLDDPHPLFGETMRAVLRNMAFEDRRRQRSDIEMARNRIAHTSDMTEARFIRDKIAQQLELFDEMDRLLSERLNLPRMNCANELSEIDTLCENRLAAYAQEILTQIDSLLFKSYASLARIENAWQKTTLLSHLASGNPSVEQVLGRISAQLDTRVAEYKDSFGQSPQSCVVRLRDIRGFLAEYTGNKAATLGSLINTHPELMIPDGFVLTSIGIRSLMDHNEDKISLIKTLIRDRSVPDTELFEKVCSVAMTLSWPETLEDEIVAHYRELERGTDLDTKVAEIDRIAGLAGLPQSDLSFLKTLGPAERLTIGEILRASILEDPSLEVLEKFIQTQSGIFVVVRSSSVLEDTHEEMMAGRFKSYPYVRGESLLIESILRCLAYYWVELSDVSDTQPVLVHSQVESDACMVINSINLADQRWDEVMISAAKGAGAGLVSGMVDSDLFLVDAATFCIRRSINPRKQTRTIFDHERGYGTRTAPIETSAEQIKASLNDEEASRAARIARRIHDSLGYPVDIEAVVKDGTIHVVQVRPIVLPLFSRIAGTG
ncbi:MAG TPA: hypothetical protein ENN34_01375, partial [Deltaproteobacteria bacterium]|nr:hypothetical protein [Deltaproteobacteria bacterium]